MAFSTLLPPRPQQAPQMGFGQPGQGLPGMPEPEPFPEPPVPGPPPGPPPAPVPPPIIIEPPVVVPPPPDPESNEK